MTKPLTLGDLPENEPEREPVSEGFIEITPEMFLDLFGYDITQEPF